MNDFSFNDIDVSKVLECFLCILLYNLSIFFWKLSNNEYNFLYRFHLTILKLILFGLSGIDIKVKVLLFKNMGN